MAHWNHNYYIYLLTNKHNTVIYTGMTNDLLYRIGQHKEKNIPGFTARYNVTKLVYYQHFDHVEDAIAREKKLKPALERTRKN